MLLKLRRILYTGSRLPWANSGIESFAEASLQKAQHREALHVQSKREMESKDEPVINTGGSDSRHPTRLANTGRELSIFGSRMACLEDRFAGYT